MQKSIHAIKCRKLFTKYLQNFCNLQLLPFGLGFLFMRKIEKVLVYCLTIIYKYSSGYQTLLKLSGKLSVEIKRLRTLALEVFKTINGLNLNLMKKTFSIKANARTRPDILVKVHNFATFRDKSLNTRPQNLKCFTAIHKG